MDNYKVEQNILIPLLKGEEVSRYLAFSLRKECRKIIENNPKYHNIKDKFELLIELTKETL